MNQQELQQFVTPYDINHGYVLEGQVVEFEIKNNSPFPFLAYEASCQCIGDMVMGERTFKASLTVSAAGAQGSTHMLLKAGDRFVQLHHGKNGPAFFDPVAKEWIDADQVPAEPEKVPVLSFHQTVTLWMDDGEDIFTIGEDKQLKLNPNKSRLIVPVKFMIVKKPS